MSDFRNIVSVTVDCSDGDEMVQETEITLDNEHLIPLVKKVAEAVSLRTPIDGVGINWNNHDSWRSGYVPTKDHPSVLYAGLLTVDEIELFEENFLPRGQEETLIMLNISLREVKDDILFKNGQV